MLIIINPGAQIWYVIMARKL